MRPLGHVCCAVLQVVICEDDSPAGISPVEFPVEFEVRLSPLSQKDVVSPAEVNGIVIPQQSGLKYCYPQRGCKHLSPEDYGCLSPARFGMLPSPPELCISSAE